MYSHCPFAAENKTQRCGNNCKGVQQGRSKAALFCTHPKCSCGYHAICYSLAHHLL